MKIKSIKKISNSSNLFDIQTISQNFVANKILVHNSMIRPIPVPNSTLGDFRLGTKAGVTDVAINAEVWVAKRRNYVDFIRMALTHDLTPIFEWCSRKNRIVVDYPEDRLVLTAARVNPSGGYVPYRALQEFAKTYDIDLVKVIDTDAQNIHELVNTIRAWENDEGVVVRFDGPKATPWQNAGHMVKIKADAYITLHRSKDAISQEKNVIGVIINDQIDDLIPILTEADAKRLRDFQRDFWHGVDKLACQMVDEYLLDGLNITDQKDFALQFVSQQDHRWHPFMYGLRKGKNVRDMIVEYIQKALVSQTKLDKARWMWGSISWNA